MQTYEPPPEKMLAAPLSDDPAEPSEEEVVLKRIHNEWVDLCDVTCDNLLKFETPTFELPRMASGEQNVKTLVSLNRCWTALFSTEHCLQLGQLNDIVRLCQRFDLKFDMSEADWPLLTVEFNSLRGHIMDGIYEVRYNVLTSFAI
jgi:hypothetical protein